MKQPFLLFLSASAGLGLLFHSCSGGKSEQDLRTLDSITVVLDGVAEKVRSLNEDSLNAVARAIGNDLRYFDEHNKDTMVFDNGITLQYYATIKKTISKFFEYKGEIMESVNFSKEQISNLKKDIEAEKLNEDKKKQFISVEIQEAEKVARFADERIEVLNRQLKGFDTLRVKVQDINKNLGQPKPASKK